MKINSIVYLIIKGSRFWEPQIVDKLLKYKNFEINNNLTCKFHR